MNNNFFPKKDIKISKRIKRVIVDEKSTSPYCPNCISLGVNKGGNGEFVFVKFDKTQLKIVKGASMWTDQLSGDNVFDKFPESIYVGVLGDDEHPEEYIEKLTDLINGGTLNSHEVLTAQDLIFLQKLFLKSKEDFRQQKCKVAADEYGEGGELDVCPE